MTISPSALWLDSESAVTCIACGETVDRENAREYDKYGDRWTRDGKEIEYLCTSCYGEYSHAPRDGLEETLVAADAGRTDRKTFLRGYYELATDQTPQRE